MSRTVIDLVDLDYTFALQAPLQVDEFCRQAQRRGVRVLKEQLEALYRAAVLTPLYRVERERRPLQKFLRTDEQRSEMAKFFRKPPDWVPLELPFFSGPLSEELRVAAQESRLHDPEVEP